MADPPLLQGVDELSRIPRLRPSIETPSPGTVARRRRQLRGGWSAHPRWDGRPLTPRSKRVSGRPVKDRRPAVRNREVGRLEVGLPSGWRSRCRL